jgi:predicted SAM-dependent methyltransferase
MRTENAETLLKLNLGCGLVAPEGWVNIDSSYNARLAKYPRLRGLLGKIKILPKKILEIPWPENIIALDVRRRLPYPDISVLYIYSSHLLEHLSRTAANKLLKECYRVLVFGGVIRIIIPDLRACVGTYIDAFQKWSENSQRLPPAEIFLESIAMNDPELMNQPFWIRGYKRFYDKNVHKWAYDEQSLTHLLKITGFKEISKKEFMQSAIKDVIYLDMPKRFEGSICLEAIK